MYFIFIHVIGHFLSFIWYFANIKCPIRLKYGVTHDPSTIFAIILTDSTCLRNFLVRHKFHFDLKSALVPKKKFKNSACTEHCFTEIGQKSHIVPVSCDDKKCRKFTHPSYYCVLSVQKNVSVLVVLFKKNFLIFYA